MVKQLYIIIFDNISNFQSYPHVVVNVEDKGSLAKVCLHHLPRGLQPHRRVQASLKHRGTANIRYSR